MILNPMLSQSYQFVIQQKLNKNKLLFVNSYKKLIIISILIKSFVLLYLVYTQIEHCFQVYPFEFEYVYNLFQLV